MLEHEQAAGPARHDLEAEHGLALLLDPGELEDAASSTDTTRPPASPSPKRTPHSSPGVSDQRVVGASQRSICSASVIACHSSSGVAS
jgi:hypothetical protein